MPYCWQVSKYCMKDDATKLYFWLLFYLMAHGLLRLSQSNLSKKIENKREWLAGNHSRESGNQSKYVYLFLACENQKNPKYTTTELRYIDIKDVVLIT